uniref:CD72 antigen n=1 Tax=Jaculus jaculus TaxID=51337 RepID=A0A8C5KK49_JACJA
MAEAVTYADLKFVKAPLKTSVSNPLGQDSESYEDGELTYENIQVPSAPGGPSAPVASSGLASSGLGDKTGLTPERPTRPWSSGTAPARPTICLQYFLLGLLLTCLLLGVAAICLGVRYMQTSQQLQQMTRVLEATNSSLRQQLRLKITQLGQKEEDLQGSRRELAQSQEALQEEQRAHQNTEGQLQTCQLEGEKTRETLRREKEQRRNLDERLRSMQDTLKGYSKCSSPDTCCPLGWVLYKKSCLYVSSTKKSWEDSEKHCSSLSAGLFTFGETHQYYAYPKVSIPLSLLKWALHQSSRCLQIQVSWTLSAGWSECGSLHPCICQRDVSTFPDGATLP